MRTGAASTTSGALRSSGPSKGRVRAAPKRAAPRANERRTFGGFMGKSLVNSARATPRSAPRNSKGPVQGKAQPGNAPLASRQARVAAGEASADTAAAAEAKAYAETRRDSPRTQRQIVVCPLPRRASLARHLTLPVQQVRAPVGVEARASSEAKRVVLRRKGKFLLSARAIGMPSRGLACTASSATRCQALPASAARAHLAPRAALLRQAPRGNARHRRCAKGVRFPPPLALAARLRRCTARPPPSA